MIRSSSIAGRRRVRRVPAALLACALLAGLPAGAASAEPRIIAGDAAAAGAWPSIARVEARYVVDGSNYLSRCAGTVVNPRWIVTAAHCTYDGTTPLAPSALTAITGRSDLARSDLGQTIAVDAVVRHPDHIGGTVQTDIALLRLAVPTAAPPMPVALPADVASYASPLDVPNVAGWGWTLPGTPGSGTNTLNETYMPLRPTADCRAALAAYEEFDPATMVCAGAPGHPTTCHGDSGGPLVLFSGSSRPVLYGITSWGSPRCDNGVTAFTRVAAFAAFLAPAVDEPVPPPPPPPPPPPALPAAPQPALPALAQASSLPGDTIAPRLSELRVPSSIAVRNGRATRAISVRLRSSEPALVRITLQRNSGGAAHRRHNAVVARGTNRLTLPRSLWRLRPGSYRLWIEATDAAGNSGAADAKLRARRARV